MIRPNLHKELLEAVEPLDDAKQRRVINYARTLGSRPRGEPGASFARFAGTIEPAELEAMKRTIEDGCERVDPNEW